MRHQNNLPRKVEIEFEQFNFELSRFINQLTINIIGDFNKILKLYAQDLAIALGTALAGDKDMKINFTAVQKGEKNFLIPSKNGG